MKLAICDICRYADNKIVESTHKIGYKEGTKIDVCQEHRSFGKDRTKSEFYRDLSALQAKYFNIN